MLEIEEMDVLLGGSEGVDEDDLLLLAGLLDSSGKHDALENGEVLLHLVLEGGEGLAGDDKVGVLEVGEGEDDDGIFEADTGLLLDEGGGLVEGLAGDVDVVADAERDEAVRLDGYALIELRRIGVGDIDRIAFVEAVARAGLEGLLGLGGGERE